MRINKTTGDFTLLLARYVCAVMVAFLVSFGIIMAAVTILDIDVGSELSGIVMIGTTSQRLFGSVTNAYIAALSGVYVGSLCVPRAGRRFACVVLTVIEVVYYQAIWLTTWRLGPHGKHGLGSLWPFFAFGGISAYMLTSLIMQQKHDRWWFVRLCFLVALMGFGFLASLFG